MMVHIYIDFIGLEQIWTDFIRAMLKMFNWVNLSELLRLRKIFFLRVDGFVGVLLGWYYSNSAEIIRIIVSRINRGNYTSIMSIKVYYTASLFSLSEQIYSGISALKLLYWNVNVVKLKSTMLQIHVYVCMYTNHICLYVAVKVFVLLSLLDYRTL